MRKSKRTLLATMTFALCLGSSMTAMAAPKLMSDGNVFDAEYYAQNNPDVVNALGKDENMLYLHYTSYGRTEGRLAVAPGTDTDAVMNEYLETNPAVIQCYDDFGRKILWDSSADVFYWYRKNGDLIERVENYSEKVGMNENTGLPWMPGDITPGGMINGGYHEY